MGLVLRTKRPEKNSLNLAWFEPVNLVFPGEQRPPRRCMIRQRPFGGVSFSFPAYRQTGSAGPQPIAHLPLMALYVYLAHIAGIAAFMINQIWLYFEMLQQLYYILVSSE